MGKKETAKARTIKSFYSEQEQTNSEGNRDSVSTLETTEGNANWSQASLEDLKRDFKNEIRELGDEFKATVSKVEKNLTEEIKYLKSKIGVLEQEVQNLTGENASLKMKNENKDKELQKLAEENNSLKIRIRQIEAKDSMMQQESVKQNIKIEKLEESAKYLTRKTTDLENRSRRDNLRIIGLPENHDEKTSLDSILQEIVKENCPEVLESEGEMVIERIHRSPPERDPKLKTPRNIVAKLQSYKVKEKILNAAKKKQFKYRGTTVRITQDLAAATLKDRREWNAIFRKAKELGLQPRINYPARLTIFFQAKRWSFNEIKDFQTFLMKKPELNGKFDLHLQDARKT
ncbi:MAG: hypothetical protein LUC24_05475 [Bacteroidales bacterium]|nr:hypothetical protein [Bacteroidales bacterium]